VICNQPRTIDLTARNGRFIEAADSELTDEVVARVQVIFDL
jgi:mRNA-degrading endonuclease toxin of MazEF toxin-antitoxin module